MADNVEERLLAALTVRDENGKRLFSPDDIRHITPILLIGKGEVEPAKWPPSVRQVMNSFFASLGSAENSEALADAIRAYYDANPPVSGLVEAIQAFLREETVQRGGAYEPSAFDAFFGTPTREAPRSTQLPKGLSSWVALRLKQRND